MKYAKGPTGEKPVAARKRRLRLPKLSTLADAATIIALGVAFYAFVRPAAVSDYLAQVSANTAAARQSLGGIETNTAGIDRSTGLLAAEIPAWLRFSEVSQADLRQHAFQYSANNLSFALRNDSNALFREIRVSVSEPQSKRRFEVLEGVAIPPGERLKFNISIEGAETDENLICVTATDAGTGRTRTEVRYIRRQGRGATLLLRTTDWALADGNAPRACR